MARAYGWALKDIQSLTVSELGTYYELSKRLKAEETLEKLNVSDYARAKDESRKKIYKTFQKVAFPDARKKTIRMTDAARMLKNGK